jgi:hypothetical protein
MTSQGKRARVQIARADEKRLLRALDDWAATGALVALRTRAFVLLLWDGAVRTRVALALNAEEVVKDPSAPRLKVLKLVQQRPCEANRHTERTFVMSERAQNAIADYLRVVREQGWLPGERLRGPLFLATVHRGTGQRLSPRSAIHCWEIFQKLHVPECSREYALDDVVYSGRLDYLQAAGGDSESLSDHSGLSRRWAS